MPQDSVPDSVRDTGAPRTRSGVGRALGRWTRGGKWRLPALYAVLGAITGALAVGARLLHLEFIFVLVVVALGFVALMGLALNPRLAAALGGVLGRWTRRGENRLPTLLAFVAVVLAIVASALLLREPLILVLLLALPVVMVLASVNRDGD